MHLTNITSKYFGKFAKNEFPKFIQIIINISYVKLMKLDMSEFEHPKYYKTLTDLFSRELKLERKIDKCEKAIISPVDAFVTECGIIKNNIAFQVKGMKYKVEDLLTFYTIDNIDKLENGSYMNFYLSPKNYHRYHAPCDFNLKKLIHVPGKLYPVNLPYLNKKVELFIENERVILECEINKKIFYMVFVGALNVGQMIFNFESKVETNKNTKEIKVYKYNNIRIKKSECLGYFKMGSTVVLLWEKSIIELENILNSNIKFGERIGKFI